MLSNYQIINSIAFSVDVTLPYPFADMLGALNVLSFDFSVLQCTTRTYFGFVFTWYKEEGGREKKGFIGYLLIVGS